MAVQAVQAAPVKPVAHVQLPLRPWKHVPCCVHTAQGAHELP